jgi:FAD/FMN-containing dehydrogenase
MLSGYSFKTSQYGLTVDNVVRYELVLPNGIVINVTSKDDDLWFGLRVSRKSRYRSDSLSISNQSQGGLNNFVRN